MSLFYQTNMDEMDDTVHKSSSAQVEVTINNPTRVLHFSDGVEEEIDEDNVAELNAQPTVEHETNPASLPWVPWFSHYAWKSSKRVLNAVDTAGENLAWFFGITTPKYQIEIDEYERMQEEKKKLEEESAGWVPKSSGGDVPLVLNEPLKVTSNQV